MSLIHFISVLLFTNTFTFVSFSINFILSQVVPKPSEDKTCAAKDQPATVEDLYDMANKLRIHSVRTTTLAKSGHPTTCSSMAEIISVLFFDVMRFDVKTPLHHGHDRLVLSKGHAAPILYAAWAEAGLFPICELDNLRKLPYDLEGHPTPRLSFIDVGTGSLGQGLSVASGMAYVGKNYDKAEYRVFCIIGDGESHEGNIWEALAFSGYYKLNNLCVILDCNRLGQSQATALAHDVEAYQRRIEAFGYHCIIVDGHSVEELQQAFKEAEEETEKPTCIIAKTLKGKNYPGIEDQLGWHGKPLGDKTDAVLEHLKGLIKTKDLKLKPKPMLNPTSPCVCLENISIPAPEYGPDDSVATRAAYGTALAKLVKAHPRVIALDGDMKNSTFSEKVLDVDPTKHIECFIGEQNMVAVGVGIACRDRSIAFCSTFGAFLCRAYDQIRMAAISFSNINICGSHSGVSIGEDGASQMALEDLAMFRAIPNCTIFYPSDAVSAERAVEIAANTEGICYIRTSRPATQVLYDNEEPFEVGRAKIVMQSNDDKVLVIGAGITLHEAIKAKKFLEENDGVNIRVMDIFTVKPVDAEGIILNALKCYSRIITVEDHYPEGGIGEAVLSAVTRHCKSSVAIRNLSVPKVPRSGPPDALLDYYGISAKHIAKVVRNMIQ